MFSSFRDKTITKHACLNRVVLFNFYHFNPGGPTFWIEVNDQNRGGHVANNWFETVALGTSERFLERFWSNYVGVFLTRTVLKKKMETRGMDSILFCSCLLL